jgi:hypothetical protein
MEYKKKPKLFETVPKITMMNANGIVLFELL